MMKMESHHLLQGNFSVLFFLGRPTSVATIAAVGATILFHMEVWPAETLGCSR